MDVDKAEKAEKTVDKLKSKREPGRESANRIEAAWDGSARRVTEKRQARNRWSWIHHHGAQHRRYTQLASEHAEKRARLLAEAGYPPDDPEAA